MNYYTKYVQSFMMYNTICLLSNIYEEMQNIYYDSTSKKIYYNEYLLIT